jgi:RND family efflux transporter MFP subunit
MKKLLVLLAVLAVIGGGFYLWKSWGKTNHANGATARPTTAVVESRDIHFAVNAAGEIGPADQVSVRPEINGKINFLSVDIGDQVKKGSILFTLDDQDLQTQRSSTLISIEAARLNVEKTRRGYERSLELYKEKLISQELFDDTKTEYDLAKNSLQKVEKDLGLVEYELTKTKILAPFDCTILTRPVSVGQAVSGSAGVAGGTEVLTIANLNEMVINAHVNQADVSRLKSDQQVEVQVEAVTGLNVTGTVERVAPQATIKNNIKGFATRILLRDVDKRIRPGMTANIKIPVASKDNVLAVSLAAVFTEQNEETQQNERFVYVKKDDTYERRPVQIGVSDFFYAEVVKGLSADEVVALELPKDELAKLARSPTGAHTNKTEAGIGKSGSGTNGTSPGTAGKSPSGGGTTTR